MSAFIFAVISLAIVAALAAGAGCGQAEHAPASLGRESLDDAPDKVGRAGAFPHVLDDSTVFEYPTYSMPPKGKEEVDLIFHTTFRRVTEKSLDGYSSPGITPEYSKPDPSNADGGRIILRGTDAQWYLYDEATFALIGGGPIPNLPQDDIEPRWDATDPNIFYFRQSDDIVFRRFDISTNTISVVRDFSDVIPGGVTILNGSEGDSSSDSRYWAFKVLGSPPGSAPVLAVITYDRIGDRVVGQKSILPGGILPDWVGISPSGTHVIFPPEDGTNPLMAYHLDFSHPVSITVSAGHSDLALDKNGRDVIVYQDNANDTISMADLETGEVTPLLAIPFAVNPDIGLHISGNSVEKPGWALVTTGGGTYQSWMDRQFWMLELKSSPRVWRLGWTRLLQCAGESEYNYFAEGWATINRPGTRLWWQSNGDVAPCGDDNEDVYEMSLPEFPD